MNRFHARHLARRATPAIWWGVAGLALSLLAAPAHPNPAPTAPPVISRGKVVDLAKHLAPEQPTVFVFLKPSSTLEATFLEELRKGAGEKVAFAAIHLKTGDEPVAKQHEVAATPTALVFDRRGRLVARSGDPGQIAAAVRKAAGVMRIDWAEPGDPRLEEVRRMLGGREPAGILRTMSLKPEYLASINELARKAHFADGFLDRRTKEMIATYVSALNKCKY